MNDFFTILMDGDNGEPIEITMRKSKVDSVQRNGKTVVVLLQGQTPISFNLKDYQASKNLYRQIASEMEK